MYQKTDITNALEQSKIYKLEKKVEYLTTVIVAWMKLSKENNETERFEVIVEVEDSDSEPEELSDEDYLWLRRRSC